MAQPHPPRLYTSRLTSPVASSAQADTAVIWYAAAMLLRLLRAMRELDVRCPEQVSVIGFDDHVWSEFFHPPLTCVSQPSYEIGQRAFQMLCGVYQRTM